MGRDAGRRGVSAVVGSLLVFAMVVATFAVYQGVVVPDQNRAVEIRHNQDVQGRLQDLRNAFVGASTTGVDRAVSIPLGARYRRRTIARNLGVSAGTIETVSIGSGAIRLENARAASNAETADYVDGTDRTFDTKAMVYTPTYTFYADAPSTVYENTLLYNRFDSATVPITGQSLIRGRRITLIAIDGNLSTARRGVVTVDAEPLSASTTRIAVVGDDDRNVRVAVPTRLSPARWEEILAGELVENGGHVTDVLRSDRGEVTIVLEAGVVYELRASRIGVGDRTGDTAARYVTTAAGDGATIVPGGTVALVVEARDRYNNPVSGVAVEASPDDATDLSTPVRRTGPDGRTTFRFTAPTSAPAGRRNVTFRIAESPAEHESVTFSVNVLNASAGAGDG